MELYIYGDSKTPIVIDTFSSLRWRRKYFEPGEFELHIPVTEDNLQFFKTTGSAVRRPGRKEYGIIENISINQEDLTVSGRMASKLLGGYIVPNITFKGTVDAVIQKIITDNSFGNIVFQANSGSSVIADIQRRWKDMLTLIQSLAKFSGIGYRLLYGKIPTLETYSGIDHSINQSENRRIIFSDDFDNLIEPVYTYNDKNYRTCAYVAGEGDGDDRIWILVGDWSNRAIYVDARDLRKGDQTDAQYEAQLRQRGLEKLEDFTIIENFEGNTLQVKNMEYLTDWDLGDIVTVQYSKWGIARDKRITEIEEIYENNTFDVKPVFGSPFPEKSEIGDG